MKRNGLFGLFAALLSGAALTAQEPLRTLPALNNAPSGPATSSVEYGFHETHAPQTTSWWFNAEHLLWRTKNHPLPVPVLSSETLDDPNAAILLGGGNPLNPHLRQGGRFNIGTFFGCDKRLGIEGSYFFLAERTDSRSVNSSGAGDSIGTVNPFFDTTVGETNLTLAVPGSFSSATTLDISSFLQGGELNGLYNLTSGCNLRVDLLGGFRYVDLHERLTLSSLSPAVPPTPANDYQILDQFATRNQFYGGQVGAKLEWNVGRFFINGTGKIAVGNMHQEIRNIGFFRQTLPTVDRITPSGVYVQPSNSGKFTQNEFAWVPEANLNIGANVTKNIRGYVGYNFLWASNVVRPGDQIDRVINTTQAAPVFGGTGALADPARPAVPFNDSTFWAQGINIGLQIRY